MSTTPIKRLAPQISEQVGLRVPARLTNRLARVPLIQHVLFQIVDKEDAELVFQKAWVRRYRRNPGIVEEYWRRYREFERIKQLVGPNSDVLDVGCGISTVLAALPGRRRVGVDPLADKCKTIHSYPDGIEAIAAPAEALPFAARSFELVLSSNALDHMSDPDKALSEMHRVLRPGGKLALTCEVFESARTRDPAHPHSPDEARLCQMVERAGFVIEFKARNPWIGISRYLEGVRTSDEHEVAIIARPLADAGH